MGMDDEDIIITVYRGSAQGKRLTPEQLRYLPSQIRYNLRQALDDIGKRLLDDVVFLFLKMIRERPRNPRYQHGRNEKLLQRMKAAQKYKVVLSKDDLYMEVFDLGLMDELTRNEGRKTQTRGWFLRYADGHEGRAHGSQQWTFVELNEAIGLAQKCANWLGWKGQRRAAFLAYVQRKFAGRHGEGIMVNLDKPLFFGKQFKRAALFGKASKFLSGRPHPGFMSWPALQIVDGPDKAKDAMRTGQSHWINDRLTNAFHAAVDQL